MEIEDERFAEENLWEDFKIPLTYDQESMQKWFNHSITTHHFLIFDNGSKAIFLGNS